MSLKESEGKLRGADDRPFLITGPQQAPIQGRQKLLHNGIFKDQLVGDVSPHRMTRRSLWSNPRKQDAHFVSWWKFTVCNSHSMRMIGRCMLDIQPISSAVMRKPTLSLRSMHPALLEMQ